MMGGLPWGLNAVSVVDCSRLAYEDVGGLSVYMITILFNSNPVLPMHVMSDWWVVPF